jgi:hypothetical protein
METVRSYTKLLKAAHNPANQSSEFTMLSTMDSEIRQFTAETDVIREVKIPAG